MDSHTQDTPKETSPISIPRPAARGMAPVGWSVLVDRFYDALEMEQIAWPEFVFSVRDVSYTSGILSIEAKPMTSAVKQIIAETMRASLTTCEMCTRSGRLIEAADHQLDMGITTHIVLCADCFVAAEHVFGTNTTGALIPDTDTPWSPHLVLDHPWSPTKDEEDDERDGELPNDDEPPFFI